MGLSMGDAWHFLLFLCFLRGGVWTIVRDDKGCSYARQTTADLHCENTCVLKLVSIKL